VYSVAHLPKAIDDIFDIEEYLYSHSPTAADRFTEMLDECVGDIAEHPYMWPIYEKDSFFRRMIIGDYVLFYSVDEKRKLLVIHRIFHHLRNIDFEMQKDVPAK